MNLFARRTIWRIQLGIGLHMTSWLIGSALSNWLSSPVRVKVKCCKLLAQSGIMSQTAQPPGFSPQTLQVSIPSQQVGSVGWDRVGSYAPAEVQSVYPTASAVKSAIMHVTFSIWNIYKSNNTYRVEVIITIIHSEWGRVVMAYWLNHGTAES